MVTLRHSSILTFQAALMTNAVRLVTI